jgi:hypothetical protein
MLARRIALAVALLAVPAALDAQQGPERRGMGMRGGMGMQENVAEFVASKAADLQLSEEQLARITLLGKELREKNEKQRAEMRAAMQGGMQNMSAAERQRMMQQRDARIMQADEARDYVLALLSAEQKTKAASLIDEWERTRPGMMRPGRPH